MRKTTIVLTLLSAASASGMSQLDALSMIESADNDSAVGQAGEVSRFQIKPHIWRRYSPNPGYKNGALARVVARQLMNDLEADFKRQTGRAPTDFDRYVLWNAGPTYYSRIGYSKSRVDPIVRERALRFANLCQITPKPSPSTLAPAPVLAARPTTAVASQLPTNAVPVVTFVLEAKPAQLEFPAFALQPELPGEAPAAKAPNRSSARQVRGMVAATVLDGR